MKKLDISLAELVFKIRAQAKASRAPSAAAKPLEAPDACVPDEVEILVWFTGPEDGLRKLGITGSVGGDDDHKIVTGTIATARLLELAALEHVIMVYGSEPLVPMSEGPAIQR